MKVFRDLTITLPSNMHEMFIKKVEEKLSDGWCRDTESEERAVNNDTNHKYYWFKCAQKGDRLAISLWLFNKKQDQLYVSNIVPQESGSLNIDQYNDVLIEFWDSFINPIADQLSVSAELTNDQQKPEDWISLESAKKLRKFSSLANKSTGSSHPLDEKRWFDFIISIVESDDAFEADKLARWLVEDDHWPQDIADDLSIEYEQETSLLKYYRSIR